MTSKSRMVSPAAGLIGFGAFGQLIAAHLAARMTIYVHDPLWPTTRQAEAGEATLTDLTRAAKCPIVILAVPVSRLAGVIESIAPHLSPASLVLDVGSVKVLPAAIMRRLLPQHVHIVATHPLFGPQSAADGITGLKIAVCPVRGNRARLVASYLRKLGLEVIFTTPEEHDREAALVQGLTHLIAKVLVQMEPLPTVMTTRSFDLVMQGVAMVRDDTPEVFRTIEELNPYAEEVRRRFFSLAAQLDSELSRNSRSPTASSLLLELGGND